MQLNNPFRQLWLIWRAEFSDYSAGAFQRDVLAGITVAAVALPLALAFGVASGATAAAGLVTAILAGVIIGGLGGAGFQISGPTGAMAAVLVVMASRYGPEGIWISGLLAGGILLLVGLFNLGQIVNVIPSAVIVGFTSGIAVIIFIGQFDNLLGMQTPHAENVLVKLSHYIDMGINPNWGALGLALGVIAVMLLWPTRWNTRFPSSLLGLIGATLVTVALRLDVPTIGTIPQTIVLADRLQLNHISWASLPDFILPALSIAALGSIESLLCGTVGSRMTGKRLYSGQELIAQGLGNIIIPFFGGVPATAAIARSSVAIKSGGTTRMTSLVHSLVLLLTALVLAPLLAQVPLAALGGVLAVTAWRMNEWHEIRAIFGRRFKSAIFAFLSTLIATVLLDLTQAIIFGVALSAVIFVVQISRIQVVVRPVSAEKMAQEGYQMQSDAERIEVVYVLGPLFFTTVSTFNNALANLRPDEDVILSLRTVPLIDTSGIAALEQLHQQLAARGQRLYLSGLNGPVEKYLERAGFLARLGREQVHWSAFEAIMAVDRDRAETQ